MSGLFDVPILGLILQLASFLVSVVAVNGPLIVSLATPLALGAMCGVICERSGVVNIGIEGMMLASAFVAWLVASAVAQAMPATPGAVFGFTPALLVALAAALATGVVFSLLHAWLSITIRADQIISGTIINIVAFGVTTYLDLLLSRFSPPTGGNFSAFVPPAALADVPVVGWFVTTFVGHGPITLTALVLVVVFQVMLFRSRWGLRTRAVGEHPRAAETVGIDVIRLRYQNVLLGGLFAGLAGAWFTIDFGSSFQSGMTNGRGFIALAAMIFGRWNPVGALGAALLFAASGALGTAIRTTPPPGQLGQIIGGIPEQVFAALPYVVTIAVLAGVVGRSTPPAADGQPYARESTT
jgi:simple sugar transport system permease protein